MEFHMQDCETGETNFCREVCNLEKIEYDEETGEPDIEVTKLHFHKIKFHIPKKYLKNLPSSSSSSYQKSKYKNKFLRNCKETYTLCDKDKVIHLKEEIILGYNKTSHRMFLIPSLIFFTQLTALVIIISEFFLHSWAHRKNLKNDNPYIYYRSPLHILTSQFCAICRSENEFNHINKLQEQTRKFHQNLKHMSRTLS